MASHGRPPFKSIDASLPGFKKSLAKCPIRDAVTTALVDILRHVTDLENPTIPGKYDFKKLRGYSNPNVYTIMIGGNHAYKLSMEIRDECAILRRVGTHRMIDDGP